MGPPTPGALPDLGTESVSPASPALAGWFFTTEPLGRPGRAQTFGWRMLRESWDMLLSDASFQKLFLSGICILLKNFYWAIVVSQFCVSFCCTMKSMCTSCTQSYVYIYVYIYMYSHMCTYMPSLLDRPATSPSHPASSSQSSELSCLGSTTTTL